LPSTARAGRRRSSVRGWLRASLLTRVAVALAAVGLLPLAAATAPLLSLNRDAMQDQVLRTNLVAASTAAARVADLVAGRRAVLRAAAGSRALAAEPRSTATTDLLTGLLAADPALVAVVVLDPAGREVVRAQRPGAAAAVEAADGGRPGEPRFVAAQGRRLLVLELPLDFAAGSVRGLWEAAAVETAVEPFATGEQASLVLADAAGAVLGEAADLSRLPAAVLAQARSARVAGAARFDVAGGAPVLAAYDTVPGTPWFVVSSQPAAAAEEVALRMRRGAWLAVGLAVLLTAALSAVAYGSLVRPLRRLVRTQRSLAGLSPQPGGGNEIEELRRSFAALERSLRDRQALEEVFLGRYQVLAVLGEGGMGTVFRGWDPRLERPVALKTLRFEAARLRPGDADQLVAEAVLAARFQHPNVVAVYDVEDTPEVSFIAMELVDGLSLEDVVERLGRLTPGDAARIGAAVARGLAAAHRRGVAHRDVKPANVLLGRDGSIKVTDFGIAALMTRLANSENRVFGTPGFVAPEVLRGEPATPSSDLFSLGVVLYTILVGDPPFVGRSLKEILLDTLRRQPTPPEDLVPAVPLELSALCLALLSKDPAQRPADGEQVAARLAAMADRLGAEGLLECLAAVDSDGKETSDGSSETTQTACYLVTGRIPAVDRGRRSGAGAGR